MPPAEVCIPLKKDISKLVVGGLLHFNCAHANQMARWPPPNGGGRGKGDRNFAPGATSIIPASYHKLAYVLDCEPRPRANSCTIVHRYKSKGSGKLESNNRARWKFYVSLAVRFFQIRLLKYVKRNI